MMRALLLLTCWLALVPWAAAHEVRPAYLQLRETSADTFEVLWKVPGRGDQLRLALDIDWPDSVILLGETRRSAINQAFIDRSRIHAEGGLSGKTIAVRGLNATMTDVLVRIEKLDGNTQVARLTPSATALLVEAAPSHLALAKTYGLLGVEHILLGFDHLIFVLALLLIIGRRGMLLLKTISAFTVAHSITLSLATLGVVNMPVAPIEALIALSIVFVAAEILQVQAGKPSIAGQKPWLVAFLFGLLHGFGFASALNETGLPTEAIPLALLMFNLGVELGQLLFVALVWGLLVLLARLPAQPPAWSRKVPPYAIGSLAMFWVIQRLSGLI